jgi:hypothetical protein
MASLKGRGEVSRFIAGLPTQIEQRLLRSAARTAATVVADEAKARAISSEVRDAIKVATKAGEGTIAAKVQVKGAGAFIAPWLEYGTTPHFISVDDAQRGGLGIRRINTRVKEAGGDGSLVINGQFVGKTVFHPGARPHPFLRPALDLKQGDAIAAAQAYINARIDKTGVRAGGDEGDAP